MWSDPEDKIETWAPSERGAGWYFGWKTVEQVYIEFKLDNSLII